MQMRGARNVIEVVILILRYRDRLRNLARIGFALEIVRGYDPLPSRKQCQSQRYRRGSS